MAEKATLSLFEKLSIKLDFKVDNFESDDFSLHILAYNLVNICASFGQNVYIAGYDIRS